jgi:ssDNA-binding Zn-finger/Zn-ribbon topoisomerase 1
MTEVRCPKCGSSMVLRTAKRGPNAGGKFYGCSRYPNCKATIPFESVAPGSQKVPEKEKRSLTETFFPRTLIARERLQNYRVRFFETVAVSEDLLEKLAFEYIEEEILKAFSQWKIDFPVEESKFTLNERQCQIISVLEKILLRGRIMLPSPQLEVEFKEIFLKTSKTESSLSLIESLVLKGYQKSQKYLWLDSKEENIFYEDILSKFLGENYKQFVLPQVELSSLLPPNVNTTGRQRADFAIFHPRLEEKIIVEIDGEQHKGHIESDKERDRALQEY